MLAYAPADHPALQTAMAERVKLRAAAAADTTSSSSESSSDSSSSSRQRAGGKQGVVAISGASDVSRAAKAIAIQVQRRGWVELSCYGGPLSTQRGVEVGAVYMLASLLPLQALHGVFGFTMLCSAAIPSFAPWYCGCGCGWELCARLDWSCYVALRLGAAELP
jgi:hypothetical protein